MSTNTNTNADTRIHDEDEAHRMAIRVAVARDVLLQLDMGRIRATSGIYMEFNTNVGVGVNLSYESLHNGIDMQKLLARIPQCDVCAVGAALYSYVRLFDGVTAQPAGYSNPQAGVLALDYKNGGMFAVGVVRLLHALLGRDFTRDIEDAFEGRRGGFSYLDLDTWGMLGTEKRMRAIMKNVIENGGELVTVTMTAEAQ